MSYHAELEAKMAGELVFIGLGLQDELGISMRGLQEAKSCNELFMELYTNVMPGLNLDNLKKLVGGDVQVLSRGEVEERAEQLILPKAKAAKVGFFVPGDPMVATTHVDLRLRAHRAGIRTRIIHAASVTSAIAAATGLQSYKFGRTVTIPATWQEGFPESVYASIKSNMAAGLHTLVLLEIDVENRKHVTIQVALKELLAHSRRKADSLIGPSNVFVAAARLEAPDMVLKAGTGCELCQVNFGPPPYALVIPSKLHFMEAEALVAFCGASERLVKPEQ